MKTRIAIMALAVSLLAVTLMAQDDGQPKPPREPGQEPGPGRRPPPPVIAVLDANHDGVIDSQEIDNASAALRKLDKNGDGKLTPDELRPPRPEGGSPDGGRPPGDGFEGGPRHRQGPPPDQN